MTDDRNMADTPPAVTENSDNTSQNAAHAPAIIALKTNETTAAGIDNSIDSNASTPLPSKEEQTLSLKVSLADLCAKGTAAYSHKEYEKAADLFAQAAEMQAEINGEMSPENAEILFLYGRSLFKVGQAKSDVLGTKAPAPTEEKNLKKERDAKTSSKNEGVAINIEEKEMEKAEEKVEGRKPLFQFTGDENFDEESDDEEDQDEEEEDDDLAVAFETLDLARVLFDKRLATLEETPETENKGRETGNGEMHPEHRHVKERLADTHDLLTEIAWENEKYAQSVTDARKSLEYKKQLYKDDNEVVAEAHYKMSLALEFASVTQSEEEAQKAGGQEAIDMALREESATQLEHAIRCTKLNLKNKEVELATVHAPEENEITRDRISEVKDVIAEMEQRLEDLRKPPIDLSAAIASGTSAAGGLLGALAAGAVGSAQVEEAKKNATDLSGLVRKKDRKTSLLSDDNAVNGTSNGSKRKAEDPPAEEENKKPKVVENESEKI